MGRGTTGSRTNEDGSLDPPPAGQPNGQALFYEVGGVAENGFKFFQERVRQSYGVSGRFTLERAAIFRADFGFSEDGMNFTAGFGLPF